MTWPFTSREVSATTLLAERTQGRARGLGRKVNRDAALKHSAAWACLRLRADLISTMPVDVFREIGGVQVEQNKPPVMVSPGGSRELLWEEWVYSTQFDVDSVGNTVGIVLAVDGLGLPSAIELAPIETVSFIGSGMKIRKVKIGRDEYDYAPNKIWHERQFTVSGSPIGLSPIGHASTALSGGLSAAQFALDWFDNSTMPGGHLKNTGRKLNTGEARKAKAAFKAAVSSGDVWVSGNDWEYSMLSAKAGENMMLEQQEFSLGDVCRFLGVPGDMIDVPAKGSSVTYANITERNLQLLIMNLGPAIVRREKAWSARLLPQPRFAKINPDGLQRMDFKSRYEGFKVGVEGRWLPPSEIRALENKPPLTPEQEAEFGRLFPNKSTAPAPPGVVPNA